jgi:hypothetical protein
MGAGEIRIYGPAAFFKGFSPPPPPPAPYNPTVGGCVGPRHCHKPRLPFLK